MSGTIGVISNLKCFQQHTGEDRRPSDLFTILMYLAQGIPKIMQHADEYEYGLLINEEISFDVDLDLDPRLIAGSNTEDLGVPPIIAAAINKLAEDWGIQIKWESTMYAQSTVTFHHLLGTFVDTAEGRRDQPVGMLGLTFDEWLVKEDEWARTPQSFLDHIGAAIVGRIDMEAIARHLELDAERAADTIALRSSLERQRIADAARIGFDVSAFEQ